MVRSHYLLVWSAAAKAKDEQVAVRVGAGEMLPISGELAVKNCAMALPFDLEAKMLVRTQ